MALQGAKQHNVQMTVAHNCSDQSSATGTNINCFFFQGAKYMQHNVNSRDTTWTDVCFGPPPSVSLQNVFGSSRILCSASHALGLQFVAMQTGGTCRSYANDFGLFLQGECSRPPREAGMRTADSGYSSEPNLCPSSARYKLQCEYPEQVNFGPDKFGAFFGDVELLRIIQVCRFCLPDADEHLVATVVCLSCKMCKMVSIFLETQLCLPVLQTNWALQTLDFFMPSTFDFCQAFGPFVLKRELPIECTGAACGGWAEIFPEPRPQQSVSSGAGHVGRRQLLLLGRRRRRHSARRRAFRPLFLLRT